MPSSRGSSQPGGRTLVGKIPWRRAEGVNKVNLKLHKNYFTGIKFFIYTCNFRTVTDFTESSHVAMLGSLCY